MDSASHGRPPTRRRRVLQDASSRANEDYRTHSPRHGDKLSPHVEPTSSPRPLPHNESLVANGTLAVRQHVSSPSPQHKRVSAVIDDCRPRNPKRDSEISNASTNASTGGRRKTHIGPWQLGKTIGKGGCSRVRIVRHSGNGQYGAAKIILKATADKVRALSLANLANSADHDLSLAGGRAIPFGLEREICIMKLLDHPNIVHLYDIWENRNEIYLIMEYVEGGELFSYMTEIGALPEIEVVHVLRQIFAALLYCHRINIHHRDLKPENILLDRDSMQIKLVDFGMAALQPLGKKLTTPCGSPHYAAPEVIAMRPYDGGKADIWSCGVILYVLLTGTPPFNYSGEDDHQLTHLFKAISRADYIMPDGISKEAQSLIRKILTVDPRKRISIEAIWDHPFLHKYDKELHNIGASSSIEHWVGPEVQLKDWQKLSPNTIDRDILRYMRTLWHSEPVEVLTRRLVSNEPNYEKYFYSALQRYQQDQLENYTPSLHRPVSYSNSDYHHNGRSAQAAASAEQRHKRSESGYSILHNEHLYSKHSFHALPSDVSYDPFRASRDPIVPVPSHTNHRNVTVHCGAPSSDCSSRKVRPTTALGHRTGSSLRVKTLRQNSKRSSAVSRTSSKRSNPSKRTPSVRPMSISRSSLGSSHWASSPPVAIRAKPFKRGVSFPHIRRSSGATAYTADTGGSQYTPRQGTIPSHGSESIASSTQSPRPSTAGESPSVRPLPRTARKPITRLKVRKPESPSKYINSEARKVSTELEKVMDEAFNRSSMGSSRRTSTMEAPQHGMEYDTPLTSFSNRDSGGTALATPGDKSVYQNRPLPPTPKETPNTFLQRKLAETRAEIAQRFADAGDHTENISLVLDKLDRLIVPSATGGMRVCSAPAKSPEQPGPLHVIPEEARTDTEERPGLQGRRAVTEQHTIRLVDQSPTRVAPLNIRKKSGASMSTKSGRVNALPVVSQQPSQNDAPAARTPLEPPLLASAVQEPKEPTVKKKKSSWFRRNLEEKERPQESQPKPASTKLQIPEKWYGLDDRIKNDAPKATGPSPDISKLVTKQSNASESSEFPMRNCASAFGKSEGNGGLKGLFGLFGRKTKEEKNRRALELGDNFSTSSIVSGFDDDSEADNPARSGQRDVQTNWLSRFLHIKPASKILCFEAKRGKVRKDIVRQLQAWEQYGMREVSCNNNVITARIDKNNRKFTQMLFTAWKLEDNVFTLEFEEFRHVFLHLQIKAVSFVIELFIVLQNDRRANVCLARFTQTQGAASGFRKAVDRIEKYYRVRSMLVEDEKKKAAMCEVLN